MDLRDLVDAVMRVDMLAARQWVADAARAHLRWNEVPAPEGLDDERSAVAAALVGLLAGRAGEASPAWVERTPPAVTPVWLIPSARTMPRLRRDIEDNCPPALRVKRVFATASYLTIA